ncbi:MAG: hypothetical protein AAB440_03830 [Patescibacteria group bacterium]
MSEDIPFRTVGPHIGPKHYYGDLVRILFVVAAVILFTMQFTGIRLPFSSFGSIMMVMFLVVAAGLTNPVQIWIHWVNIFISAFCLILFGGLALSRFQNQQALFPDGILIGTLALMFMVALYSAVKTLRGILMRDAPTIR